MIWTQSLCLSIDDNQRVDKMFYFFNHTTNVCSTMIIVSSSTTLNLKAERMKPHLIYYLSIKEISVVLVKGILYRVGCCHGINDYHLGVIFNVLFNIIFYKAMRLKAIQYQNSRRYCKEMESLPHSSSVRIMNK